MIQMTLAVSWLAIALTIALTVAVATIVVQHHRYTMIVAGLQRTITDLTTPEHLRTYRGDLEDRLETDHAARSKEGKK